MAPLVADAQPPKHETVLVVEDDAAVRDFVADVLRRFDYEVIVAANGAEAVSICNSELHFDLLFTDVVMPGGVSGITLANHARERRPNIKILLTSGYTGHPSVTADLEFPLIQKPYRIRELLARVRDALDRSGPESNSSD